MTEQAHSLAEYMKMLRGGQPVKVVARELGIGVNTVIRAESGRPLSPTTVKGIITRRQLSPEAAHSLLVLAAQAREPQTVFPAETTQLDIALDYPDEEIAERSYQEQLAYLRKRAGLTFDEITQRGDLPEHTAHKIEQGKIRRPSPETLQKLRNGLELPDESPLLQPKPLPRHSTVKRIPEIPPEELATMTPGKQLAYWRKRERLGQPALAKELDVPTSRVKSWEYGKKKPIKTQREALARALHIPVEEIDALFTPPIESLAELITFYREDYGLSKEELALRAGLNRATIRSIEQGDTPSQATLAKLIAVFKFAPDSEEARKMKSMMGKAYFAKRQS